MIIMGGEQGKQKKIDVDDDETRIFRKAMLQ